VISALAFRREKVHKHFVEVGVVGTTAGVVGTTVDVAGCNRTVFCEVRVGVSTGEDA
jgi:hypothetical protein